MGDYVLKYDSYREYKKHRSREQMRSSAKYTILVGIVAGAAMSSGDESLLTQVGTTLLYMAFAFVGTYAIFLSGEDRTYVKREFERNSLDEEMYRTDETYRTEVDRLIALESTKRQLAAAKEVFINENKNRFGK